MIKMVVFIDKFKLNGMDNFENRRVVYVLDTVKYYCIFWIDKNGLRSTVRVDNEKLNICNN
jgi:hypothetical protein